MTLRTHQTAATATAASCLVMLAPSAWASVQPAPMGPREVPLAAATVHRASDGRLVITSPWVEYSPPPRDSATVPIFDAFQADATGTPTGFCAAGCNQNGWCPSSPPSHRWWGGTLYRSPFSVNDMIIPPAFAGTTATRAQFAWMWAHDAPTHCYIAIFTVESYDDCTVGPPGFAGAYDGVVMDFGPVGGGVNAGYHYTDVDFQTYGYHWQMPLDGAGGYGVAIATGYDIITGALTLDTAWGTQPMQWGTGSGVIPNDGRPGDQGPTQWDDWADANGTFQYNECAYYNDITHCPNPSGAMLAFFGPPLAPPCYANCDGSTQQPVLNVADFTCFLQQYAAADSYANCDGSTQPPVLNVADFTCFLQKYAAGCPH